MRPQALGAADGCVPAFHCSEPNMSFVRYALDYDVIEIAEKRPISSWATVGLYGFRSAACFAERYQEAYESGRIRIVRGERYVAPIYELMLIRGERVVAPRLATDDVNILGTPAQVLSFDPSAHPPFGNTTSMR
jgi:dTDP-glucose pyrophosphorylase